MKEIVFAQIKEYYPDVIYLQDLYTFTSALRNELREKCGNDVILIGSRSSPTKDFGSFRDLDLIVTAVPKYFEMFRLFGCKPLLLSHAFEHSLLDYFKPKPVKDIDFSFCGSLGTGRDDFSQRIAIMRKLLKETPLRIWGRTEKTNDSRSLQNFTKLLYHANVFMNAMGISREIRSRIPVFRRYAYCSVDPTVLPIDTEYQKRFYPPVFGLDYYSVLARSKIVLNIHGEDPGGEAVNMRLYEATGMGSCLLTDWMENLPSLFDPKKEVIAYRNANECIDNVGYLLENDDDREKIAKSGQERTLKNYTYEKKINQLHERILSLVQ